MKTTTRTHRCAICGRKLRNGRWITGHDRKLQGRIPRYCWPSEGCSRWTR